ncbi:MICAL-like protein 1 isoform X2 [Uloborus diversus]|uniref:MICAL-like protein 1 isoform X2 n=1 Tax=Uloborus diversus TaxID=327109 RepID=UPI00240A2BBD|nr:MICAL-like protein 1 isoform X2 [Uloborus diversus]
MDSKSRGLIKSLENWAKKITTGYRDVNICNLSSSFRDGLAFCAIIHHYRPDLIDFDSLSKENILENNSTAFKVAEKSLGVPALLDAEDMVAYAHPDRLSIITYLSQLYNCFENQNKVSNLKSNLKRINHNETAGPPVKLPVVQSSLLTAKRHEVCRVCAHRVYILERLIVDGKLYHTQCFKCSKCNSLLNPGAYVESDTPGLYECSVCPDESMEQEYSSESEPATPEAKVKSPKSEPSSLSPKLERDNNVLNPSPLLESVSRARNSFLQNSLSSHAKTNGKAELAIETQNVKSNAIDQGISVKAKISAFESNQVPKTSSLFQPSFTSETSTRKLSALAGSNEDNSSVPNVSPTPMQRLSVLPSDTNFKTTPNCDIPGVKNVISKTPDTENSSDRLAQQATESRLPSTILTNEGKAQETKSVVDSSLVRNAITPPVEMKSTNLDRSRILTRPLSSTTEYKSPLKSPRDIFQTNIQPLKLTSQLSNKKDSPSFSAPPLNSAMDFKNVQIPQIRSTYSSLPRPGSYQSLTSKDHPSKSIVSNSETNLSDQAQSENSGIVPRRRSLGSKHDHINAEDVSGDSTRPKHFLRTQSSVELKANAVSMDGLPETNIDSDISRDDIKKNDSNCSHDLKASFTPVPKARLSLEKKSKTTNSALESNSKTSLHDFKTKEMKSSLGKEISGSKAIKIAQRPKIDVKTGTTIKQSEDNKEDYPDDLNPFGSDDDGNEQDNEEEYPDDLNPFGDEDEDNETSTSKTADVDYDDSKNPFASDEDEEELTSAKSADFSGRLPASADISPFHSNSFSNISSPTGSLSGTARKRQAPRPPKLSDIFPNESVDSEADTSLNSLKSSPSISKKNLQTPSPKIRKSKPAPPPPPSTPNSKQSSQTDLTAGAKKAKELDNLKLKSSTLDSASEKDPSKQNKKKKRPAPPVPIPARKDMKKIPLKEIMQEMKEIEEKQREYERQGREIELLIRDRDKDEEPSVEEEEYIMQLFELVNQKNALFRRQAELMYIKRSQRLEEQQYEIDKQLRILMEKPDSEKTAEDRLREEELTMELIDIVDQRNSIIDSIEMDRRREIEEDVSVQVQLEIKNAEIKEKSGKKKKVKVKKEKKKNQENGSSESSKKGTLKKKIFSKKQAS